MNEGTLIPIESILSSAPVADVFSLLDQVAKKLREIQRMTVNEINLTPPQYQTLRLLWEQDGQPFKDLAEANGCKRPTMTGIVDTLEKNGLVRRQPNPDDRRSLLVTLTQKGKDLEGSTPDLGPGQYLCPLLCGVERGRISTVRFAAWKTGSHTELSLLMQFR